MLHKTQSPYQIPPKASELRLFSFWYDVAQIVNQNSYDLRVILSFSARNLRVILNLQQQENSGLGFKTSLLCAHICMYVEAQMRNTEKHLQGWFILKNEFRI